MSVAVVRTRVDAHAAGEVLRGTIPLSRLLLRRYRVPLLSWIIPIVTLTAVTVPSYASSYPDLSSRGPLVASLRSNQATTILYGHLPLPGTLGQLAQWEVGTYVVLLTAVMALTVTVSMTRVDEETGRTEVVAAAGLGAWTPSIAVAGVMVGVNLVLGVGLATVLALQSIGSAELTVAGAFAFGSVVTLTGVGVAAMTMVIAELCWDASSTRRIGWAILAVAFAARVGADLRDWNWLRALSWFGLKDAVAPYTADRIVPLLGALAVSAALFVGAVALHRRRDFGAGVLAPPRHQSRPLAITSSWGLIWRLRRGALALWSLPVIAIAALFGGMSHALITLAGSDSATASMFDEISSDSSPVRQYFGFTYVFIALLPMIYGVQTVLGAAGDERNGLLDIQLAAGLTRPQPLLARALLAALGSIYLLVLGATVQAALASAVADGTSGRWAWGYPAAQVGGVLAAVGLATAAVGRLPRLSTVAWAVVAWSAFAAIFADLVKLPSWARSASLLGHLPGGSDGIARWLPWGSITILTGLAVVAAASGALSIARRDIIVVD